jgi:hypothetical protein
VLTLDPEEEMSAVSRESATALHDATHPLERLVMSGGLPENIGSQVKLYLYLRSSGTGAKAS